MAQVVHTYRHPSLSPRTGAHCAAMVENPLAGPGAGVVEAAVGAFSEDAHGEVVENGAHHHAGSLDVQSPASVLVLMAIHVPQHLPLVVLVEHRVHCARDVHAKHLMHTHRQ